MHKLVRSPSPLSLSAPVHKQNFIHGPTFALIALSMVPTYSSYTLFPCPSFPLYIVALTMTYEGRSSFVKSCRQAWRPTCLPQPLISLKQMAAANLMRNYCAPMHLDTKAKQLRKTLLALTNILSPANHNGHNRFFKLCKKVLQYYNESTELVVTAV